MANKEIIKMDIFPLEKLNYSKISDTESVSFTGSPSKHPYEDDKFILIRDPLSDHTDFIEFYKNDVLYVEELPSILSRKNETINICRVWIKEGVVALKIQPFVVSNTKKEIDGRLY